MGPFDHGVLHNTHEADLIQVDKDKGLGKITPEDNISSSA